ncbi:LacI family DNA-binding transcriptional regulator [Alkalibacterium indicireducens]|uniref:LacI family DNA-binding transcriptional regulator n=1 Tax=Alkalibacterium indicireducens TaxID=398758 RepID=A0ABP3K7G1_9LACT
METHITIQDVAEKAGVSKTTVSRFLNKKYEYMSERTKNHIEKVIEELDYRPSKQAQYLKSKKSSLIGLLVADIENLYTAFLIKSLQATLQLYDYQMIIMNNNNSIEEEKKSIRQLLDQNIAGLLIQPVGDELSDHNMLKEAEIPIVQVDRYLKKSDWTIVQSNNYQVTKELAEEISRKGYEKIIHVTEEIGTMTPRIERYEAMMNSALIHGIDLELIELGENKNKLLEFLKKKKNPVKTVLFGANGNALYEIVFTIQQLGISVPVDYGICGFDDWLWADLITPGITSIHQQPYKIGKRAAEIMISELNNEEQIGEKIEISATIHYRSSL